MSPVRDQHTWIARRLPGEATKGVGVVLAGPPGLPRAVGGGDVLSGRFGVICLIQ